MAFKGVPNEHFGHPMVSQKGPLVTQGGPKVDQDGLRDPFGTQVISRTVLGRRARFGGLAFLAVFGRTWSLQGPILDPRGVPKRVQKSTWEGKVGTFGGQGGPKGSCKGGPKMGSEK